MLRLLRANLLPSPRDVMNQRRHAERVAMRWTPCPVMEILAHHAEQDAALLARRLRAGIENGKREHDAFWSAVAEREAEAQSELVRAAMAARHLR